MPTKNFPIYRDSLLAKSGSTPVGGGNDEHLPIGVGGAYNFKAALKFTLDWSGVTKILSARLYLRTTTKVHATSWGSNPDLIVERLDAGNFSENSGRSSYDDPSGSGWSGAASDFDSAAVQPGPDNVNWTVPTPNESTWYSVDITLIVANWAPTSVLKPAGTPGGNTPNYGILIRPASYAVANTVEFASRKSAQDPYIVLTYESNVAPTATVTAPVNGSRLLSTDLTPSIACAFVESGSIASYDVQVATDTGFTSLVWDLANSTVGLSGLTSTIPYAGTALVPGTVYYVRARATDDEGAEGAWSPTISFRLNRPPTSSGEFGSGFVARVHNLADLTAWTLAGLHAKPEFRFTPTDADGDPVTGYEARITQATSGGTVFLFDIASASADGAWPGTPSGAGRHWNSASYGGGPVVATVPGRSLDASSWDDSGQAQGVYGDAGGGSWQLWTGPTADKVGGAILANTGTKTGYFGSAHLTGTVPAGHNYAWMTYYGNVWYREIELKETSGAGSTVIGTDQVLGAFTSGAQITRQHTQALINGTAYTVAFRARDAYEWGAWTSELAFKVRWGEGIYEYAVPAGSAGWRMTFGALVGSAMSASAFRRATGAGGAGATAWSASLPTPPAGAGYLNVRVRLASFGSSPTQPQLPDMEFAYDASSVLPVGWVFSDTARSGLDVNVRRYGQNSIRMEVNAGGGNVDVTQDVSVSEDTDYTHSVWVKLEAPLVNATLAAALLSGTTLLDEVTLPATIPANEWYRLSKSFRIPEGVTEVTFRLRLNSTSGAVGVLWIDASMLDEGTVAGQWTPALIGLPVIIDAQGIIIDARAGAILKMTTSDGSVVTLGADGLYLDGVLIGPYTPPTDTGTSFPVSPTLGQRWIRSDLDYTEFFWNGTYWLSTQLFETQGGPWAGGSTYTINFTATQAQVQRASLPVGLVGSDLYLEDFTAHAFIASGGTALAAGHKWGAVLNKMSVANAATVVATAEIASGASNNWRQASAPLNVLLGTVAAFPTFKLDWTKTGTPGALNDASATPFKVTYRLRAT